MPDQPIGGRGRAGRLQHFMLKEIFEQPHTVENAMRGRIVQEEATTKFGGLNLSVAELRSIDQIVITACGTSWHAALVGEYLFEEFAHIPVEVEYASEFRSALTPGAAAGRYRHLAAALDSAILAESARWGNYRRDVHPYKEGPYELYTRDAHWRPEVKRLVEDYFPKRSGTFIAQLQAVQLYSSE